jgi:hypothetical protein
MSKSAKVTLALMPPAKSVQVQQPKKKKNKAGKPAQSRLHPTASGSSCTKDYINSLNAPFEQSGCRLGWGCFVPTRIVQAYYRGSATAASGTFAVSLYPCTGGGGGGVGMATTFTTANVSTGTMYPAVDAPAMVANYSAARIISGGVRAYPDTALTDVPGACYVGHLPGQTFGQFQDLTVADLVSAPYTQQFRAYEGATATLRPQDVRSFAFDQRIIGFDSDVFEGSDAFPVSIPYVAFTGLPDDATVFFEVVLNLECIPLIAHSSAAMGIGNNQIGSKLSSYWASAEQLWDVVEPYLSDPGTFGAATTSITSGLRMGRDSVLSSAAKFGISKLQNYLLK